MGFYPRSLLPFSCSCSALCSSSAAYPSSAPPISPWAPPSPLPTLPPGSQRTGFSASASSPNPTNPPSSSRPSPTPAPSASGRPSAPINAPASVDSHASLQLHSDGDLLVSNGSSFVVWQSYTFGKVVTAASLSETGNSSSRTAAALPSAKASTTPPIPSSRLKISPLALVFSLHDTGNLTLTWNDSVFHFSKEFNSSFTANRTLTSRVLTLQTNGIVSFSDGSLSTSVVVAYNSDYGESGVAIRLLRLEYSDGNLRAYSFPSGSSTATDRWSAVADQCELFGWCGNMGICRYSDPSPVCGCPSKNFEFVDPSDSRKWCKRTTEIEDCPGNSTMLPLDNALFLTYPPEISTEQFFVGITACRLNCLSGSSCCFHRPR